MNTENRIPKNIFQTFETKDLSPEFQAIVNSWKEKNPNYEYHFHDKNDREEFIRTKFDARIYNAYKRIVPGAYKADLWRYCVLYIHGGIYIDIDSVCLGEIDTFLNSSVECMTIVDFNLHPTEGKYNLANGCIASIPKFPVLLECIHQIVEHVERNHVPSSKLDFSGPGLLGRKMNLYLNLPETEPFVGKEGLYKNIHFLTFELYTEYVKDLDGNRLFQNKNGNANIVQLYAIECQKANVQCWMRTTTIILPEEN